MEKSYMKTDFSSNIRKYFFPRIGTQFWLSEGKSPLPCYAKYQFIASQHQMEVDSFFK